MDAAAGGRRMLFEDSNLPSGVNDGCKPVKENFNIAKIIFQYFYGFG